MMGNRELSDMQLCGGEIFARSAMTLSVLNLLIAPSSDVLQKLVVSCEWGKCAPVDDAVVCEMHRTERLQSVLTWDSVIFK